MFDDSDFYESGEDYEGYPVSDKYFVRAQKVIKDLYEANREGIYYLRQLQVRFEKQFFHWVTNNALVGLFNQGYLRDYRMQGKSGTATRFFIHKSNRYVVREANRIQEIINRYSEDHITRSCGCRAEDLFCKALALHGFMPVGQKIREFDGRKWTKTGHDLDFAFCRDGVNYGCEVKNTLGYINKEELDVKLEMCKYLGLRPLFIMRYAPKTYINLIQGNGGFALIFEAQIYELSQDRLVKDMKEELGLPVICSRAIPEGIILRFEKWHDGVVGE